MSKPVCPPWHDGSKNLVRDIATHLTRARATVMTVRGGEVLGGSVTSEPVFRAPSRFSPSALGNARVLGRLLAKDPHDAWHFVFAPNAASSNAAKIAKRFHRGTGFRGPVVQTVASAPKNFADAPGLLFGDVVIALSEWTKAKLEASGASRPIRVIPPCAAAPAARARDSGERTRARYRLGGEPFVLYAGDYEVSSGARTFGRAALRLAKTHPEARFVFACRPKTPKAKEARAAIEVELASIAPKVFHLGEIDDLHALLAEASALAFPVDDLYGKVDFPLVLLEAMALGVPVVAARYGPLAELEGGAELVPPEDDDALAARLGPLLGRVASSEAGIRMYHARFSPSAVASAHDELYVELVSRRW